MLSLGKKTTLIKVSGISNRETKNFCITFLYPPICQPNLCPPFLPYFSVKLSASSLLTCFLYLFYARLTLSFEHTIVFISANFRTPGSLQDVNNRPQYIHRQLNAVVNRQDCAESSWLIVLDFEKMTTPLYLKSSGSYCQMWVRAWLLSGVPY